MGGKRLKKENLPTFGLAMQNITNYSHMYNLGHERKYIYFKDFIYSQGTQQLVVKGMQQCLTGMPNHQASVIRQIQLQ